MTTTLARFFTIIKSKSDSSSSNTDQSSADLNTLSGETLRDFISDMIRVTLTGIHCIKNSTLEFVSCDSWVYIYNTIGAIYGTRMWNLICLLINGTEVWDCLYAVIFDLHCD